MNPALIATLRELLEANQVAALGTLHGGEPFVSMVPFAVLRGGAGFVLLVSGLASHTHDMQVHEGVSLMVMAGETAGVPDQARPRVTVQGRAELVEAGGPAHAAGEAAYLARFSHSAGLFELADFRIVVIHPVSLRVVAGFGQAASAGPEALAAAMDGD